MNTYEISARPRIEAAKSTTIADPRIRTEPNTPTPRNHESQLINALLNTVAVSDRRDAPSLVGLITRAVEAVSIVVRGVLSEIGAPFWRQAAAARPTCPGAP